VVNYLNPEQMQQLKEVGTYLRQQRLEKSISIEEIAAQTFISVRILKAVEAGESEDLPQAVFIQGFIRRYAKALGINSESVAESFVVNPPPAEVEVPPEEPPPKPSKPIPIYFISVPIAIAVGIAAAVGLLQILHQGRTSAPVQVQKSPLAKPVKTAIKSPSPSPAVTPSVAPTPNSPIEVTLNLQGQSWLRVVVDGKTEFEGLLDKGDRKTWTAQKQLTIRSGNAGAVLVSFNNGESKPLGPKDDIKEVTYTPIR
jgi:cytoskeletal protein RodZ